MNIDRLAEWFPQLPLGLFLGLILSACFRRRAWATLIWVPTMVSFCAISLLTLTGAVGLAGLRGPDSGWSGFEIIILLPFLGLGMAGVAACYFCRPKNLWNSSQLIISLVICAAALWFLHWNDGAKVTIQLTDPNAHPVSHVSLSYNGAPRLAGSSHVEFSLSRSQSIEVRIDPVSPGDENLGSWNVRFSPVRGDSGKIEVRYSRSRMIGFEHRLFEGFTETIAFARHLTIPLILIPGDVVGPDPMRNKIKTAFLAIAPKSGHRGLDYGSVCRNLTAVDFIQEFIQLAHDKPDLRISAVEGLKAISITLSELYDGCRELENALSGAKSRSPEALRRKIWALGEWAGVQRDGALDDRQLLAQVQQKIFSLAQPIVSFCLSPPPGMTSPDMLPELGRINRPHLSDFVQKLLANPPDEMQTALGWSRVFYAVKATRSELKLLVESSNPLLQAAARDAIND